MAQPIQIAMLNADVPVPVVRTKYETYGDIFHELLTAALSRTQASTKIHSVNYDVRKGEYPESLASVDAVIITGSASSAYDQDPWIPQLDKYVQHIYYNHPHIKIFGSCFGHQLLCQSLLGVYGIKVEKDPNGWELGVQEIQLSDEFRDALAKTAGPLLDGQTLTYIPKTLQLQFVHADHVKIPPGALPQSWMTIGHTQHCAVQGVYQPGRVLTYQGHFEFDRFVNTEVLKVFGAKWPYAELNQALVEIDRDDDSGIAAEMALQFLLDGQVYTQETGKGLLTPPLEK
ncbi:class I glutamine amidotransferase-like protein [Aaosphaeria arxii CBS 175.79]|uniref:Class I glutamine amidotransferase-like protein n=1 Tax=Aaosphaeria arxii CBS 175.79 TaxID=1450172 RepID=A0A6A5XF83_9PLEO|nr:class I glutamine amidotransferase-like protein [Aaosphaeria arxii CBS 175.79]KAF2011590.1 class I glutamine amidotransferase-like protein [Aaosphaeria arxii CBS 175.79]